MQVKQSKLKKAFEYMAKIKTPNCEFLPKVSLKFYVGGVPRKKLIVPQNFWADSPLSFWGKLILLAMSLFFGLVVVSIFFAGLFRTILN